MDELTDIVKLALEVVGTARVLVTLVTTIANLVIEILKQIDARRTRREQKRSR
jgi:hypothetical protein